jgi:hypothetical protein
VWIGHVRPQYVAHGAALAIEAVAIRLTTDVISESLAELASTDATNWDSFALTL